MTEFVEVTHAEFFAAIGHQDVHPRPEPDVTFWEIRHSRVIVGKSTPGWRAQGPKVWMLPASIDRQ